MEGVDHPGSGSKLSGLQPGVQLVVPTARREGGQGFGFEIEVMEVIQNADIDTWTLDSSRKVNYCWA